MRPMRRTSWVMKERARRAVWPLLLACVTCASCTHLENVPLPQYGADDLVGHEVRVTTTDGRVLQFEVDTVTDDAISGEGERVAFSDIRRLERRELSGWKTAGAVATVLAVAASAALLVFLAVWMDALGGN